MRCPLSKCSRHVRIFSLPPTDIVGSLLVRGGGGRQLIGKNIFVPKQVKFRRDALCPLRLIRMWWPWLVFRCAMLSNPFEIAATFPIGDAAAVGGLFEPGRVCVEIDDRVAHRIAGELAAAE